MNKYYDSVIAFVQAHREEMLEEWETLVNMEDHFSDPAATRKVRDWLQGQMEREGFSCQTFDDLAPGYTGPLVGILGKDRPGKPVIFSGHLDTVQPMGSFGEKPFFIEDGKAYGPGVLDMKGGIIIALYVVKALSSLGYRTRPIKFVFAAEEESSHTEEANRVTPFFTEQAGGALCAFNMETGPITNCLCTGRKAKYEWFVTVHGVGGHAGNDFARGRNALHEAAIKIAALSKLSDPEKGTTVTASVCHAGTAEVICSIPEVCEFIVETRFTCTEEQERILREMTAILTETYIEGTSTEFRRNTPQFLAFHPTGPILEFLDFLNSVAKENGFPEFGSVQLGGASDAGAIAASGIPTLCSCGVIGQFNHNPKEYAVVESLFDRTKLYTLAVLSLPSADAFV